LPSATVARYGKWLFIGGAAVLGWKAIDFFRERGAALRLERSLNTKLESQASLQSFGEEST
jgi:hypothetical protein